jgi:Rad3-related DNA helicase
MQEAVNLFQARRLPYLATIKAPGADVAVCDFNQVFTTSEGLLARTGREPSLICLVVDEAHNLPTRIMDNHSAELNERSIAMALSDARIKRLKSDLEVVREAFREMSRTGERRSVDPWELDEAMEKRCGTSSSGLAQEMLEELGEEGPVAEGPSP